MLSGFTRYGSSLNVLALVGGHPFDRNAFAAMFDTMDDIAVNFVDHPAASAFYHPDTRKQFDVLLLYDVPGIDLYKGLTDQQPDLHPLSMESKKGLKALLDEGIGILALHHAIAGWPDWDGYANYLGGRFQYLSGTLNDKPVQDSGYLQNVSYDIATYPHPVTEGLPEQFNLTDELYLYEVFDADVVPLLRAQRDFADKDFYSAEAALRHNRMHFNDGWQHSPGSDLLAWAKVAGQSPLVYIQPGDDARTYGNPDYQRLVKNALHWVASEQAHTWAKLRSKNQGGYNRHGQD